MNLGFKGISVVALSISLAACGQSDDATNNAQEGQAGNTPASEQIQSESERLNAFFEEVFNAAVDRSPTFQAFLGIKKDNDKWGDNSEEHAQAELEITRQNLVRLAAFDYEALDEATRLSYDLFKRQGEREIETFKYHNYNYPINTMGGTHTQIPTFLMNFHRVDNVDDAEAYISRLSSVDYVVGQLIDGLTRRQEMGILAPQFVYPIVLPAAHNAISGAPFDQSETDNPVFADFKRKIGALELTDEQKADLTERARAAMVNVYKPAFEQMIAFLEAQAQVATTDDGVWKFPDGEAFYASRLEDYTTTTLSADEIHQIGLDNVARIHDEMREIMAEVGFEGTLQEFFAFTREDDQFYYDNTDEGREAYLAEATRLIDEMKERLPSYFGLIPQAPLVVTRVEPFRERAAGKAFYQSPSLDGSRPGRYYANLYDMRQMPSYQMAALAYHEGIPGHHMQRAIAQELEGIPTFQKFLRATAYTEGWGLYSEYLPKEMGFYEDPYSDFGRLAMELWRACRLVVDTGLHSNRWTREQAIQYLKDNTPNPEGDITTAINRYISMAGQATAYLIGKIKILELREWAHGELGEAFDIREFHDEVLRFGPVPLDVLETNIQNWVSRQQAG
jgi:uncharacterized protein (DUF885 family)